MATNRPLIALALLGATALVAGLALVAFIALQPVEGPVQYTVVRGDTLFEIARDHGVSLDDLRTWNGIEGDDIDVGQVLEIWTTAAPAAPAPASAPRSKKRPSTTAPPGRAELEMPEEKPCLDGPALSGTADQQMAASEGLSHAQVKAAMNAFLPNVLPCIAEADAAPIQPLRLDFVVGCNGRVKSVYAADRGDWSPDLSQCVTDVLQYAAFPAHALPDGDSFTFPLTYRPPE